MQLRVLYILMFIASFRRQTLSALVDLISGRDVTLKLLSQ